MALPPDASLISTWKSKMQNSKDKATAGVMALQTSPGQLAAAQASKWQQNVSSDVARQRFVKKLSAFSLADYQTAMTTKGIPTATARANNITTQSQSNLLAAIHAVDNVAQTVRGMPSATEQDRDSRMLAQVHGARKLKGNIG